MKEDRNQIAIIGGGPTSIISSQMLQDKISKEVTVVNTAFANAPIFIRNYHVPEILIPSEPNNRHTRRKNLRIERKRK